MQASAELRLSVPGTVLPTPITDPRSLYYLFDHTIYALEQGAPVRGIVSELVDALDEVRAASPARWSAVIAGCRRHPLYRLFEQDPFTARARAKPRGYAGDADVLDYIYRGPAPGEAITPLGRALLSATTGSQASLAIRNRRDLVSQRIDACAARTPRPRVLSVGCGHLREAETSAAVRWYQVSKLTAVDQDADTLATLAANHAGMRHMDLVHGSVRDLLAGTIKLESYDFVYATGLYEYLSDDAAARLTPILFDALAPRGELLLSTFVPNYASVGYFEAFMDWHRVCRSASTLANLAATIPSSEVARFDTHADATGSIRYLTLART